MSDFPALAAVLVDLYAGGDDGSGPPARVSDHEADRLAGHARPQRRTDGPAPRLRLLRRRSAARSAHPA
ncbi:hypothetical protein [Kitasatospora camelliae]|uniref:Uncharacterized protein n=1 Tax=Kitasatospora camelliae TaxID=3156397 RepID=A0AAU8JU48_9ACTN